MRGYFVTVNQQLLTVTNKQLKESEMEKATLTSREFREAVNISRTTEWQLRKQGRLPHCRVGSKILYLPAHVTQFLEAHERHLNPPRRTHTKRKGAEK